MAGRSAFCASAEPESKASAMKERAAITAPAHARIEAYAAPALCFISASPIVLKTSSLPDRRESSRCAKHAAWGCRAVTTGPVGGGAGRCWVRLTHARRFGEESAAQL